MLNITTQDINNMNLFDIVNFLNLDFTIPGGDRVMDFWVQETNINSGSVILDVACSTGFISRSISRKTGCTGFGIDIDPRAIDVANSLKEEEGLGELLHYEVQDAAYLHFDNDLKFSHILFGNALAFLEEMNRTRAISLFKDYLREDGLLLVNSLFYKEVGDKKVLEELATLCDLKVNEHCSYEYWNSLFERNFNLIVEGEIDATCKYHFKEDVVQLYVKRSLSESKKFQELPEHIQNSFFERLLAIRLKGNENHRYLDSRAQVWKKR